MELNLNAQRNALKDYSANNISSTNAARFSYLLSYCILFLVNEVSRRNIFATISGSFVCYAETERRIRALRLD